MIDLRTIADVWEHAMWRASWQTAVLSLAVWLVCRFAPRLPGRIQAWLWRAAVLKFLVACMWLAPLELPLLPARVGADPRAEAVHNLVTTSYGANASIAETSTAGIPLLFLLWCGGVAWLGLQLVNAYRASVQIRRQAKLCVDERLLVEVAKIGEVLGLRRLPRVLISARDCSPALVGIWRPAIVLSKRHLSSLTIAEQRLVLAHELAHCQRWDVAWSALAAVVRTVGFFHPGVWFCERQLRAAQEVGADEQAIRVELNDPVAYAQTLLSIVAKITVPPREMAFSLGMAGTYHSLQQRLTAMQFSSSSPTRRVIHAMALASVMLLGLVPWRLVAAEQPTAGQTGPVVKSGAGRGRFLSYVDGVLTIVSNDGTHVKNDLSGGATVLKWGESGKYEPAEAVATLQQAKPGTYTMVFVDQGKATVRIGARAGTTVGTFISFQDRRLLILGKNLGASFVKKYGNSVHFNRFRDDVPAFESIDGGPYQPIGKANEILGNVKEGSVVTVHAEGDDNITRVEIGVVKP